MVARTTLFSALLLIALDSAVCRLSDFSMSNLAMLVRPDEKLQNVIDYVQLKLGSHSKQSYWHYSGVLRNPLTGREIVGIEGVEVVRAVPISQEYEMNNTIATAFLSKKLFMYVDRANASNLLEQYRLQRQAPLRPVKAVNEIVEKVTLGIDDKGQTFASITWPGSRRTITNNRISIEPLSVGNSFLGRMVGRKKLNVVNFMTAGVPIQSIPRNSLRRWISFSPGGQDDRAGRSQEYYAISNMDSLPAGSFPSTVVASGSNKKSTYVVQRLTGAAHKPEAVLTYQRHGEGPAWYAVGRACVVELTGARYASEKCLPKYVRELVQRANPAFFDLSVPAMQVATRDSRDTSSTLSASPAAVEKGIETRDSQKQTLLTQAWFDAQADPADNYKPWYSHIRSCIATLRK